MPAVALSPPAVSAASPLSASNLVQCAASLLMKGNFAEKYEQRQPTELFVPLSRYVIQACAVSDVARVKAAFAEQQDLLRKSYFAEVTRCGDDKACVAALGKALDQRVVQCAAYREQQAEALAALPAEAVSGCRANLNAMATP